MMLNVCLFLSNFTKYQPTLNKTSMIFTAGHIGIKEKNI